MLKNLNVNNVRLLHNLVAKDISISTYNAIQLKQLFIRFRNTKHRSMNMVETIDRNISLCSSYI
jgi:hypothetical protein